MERRCLTVGLVQLPALNISLTTQRMVRTADTREVGARMVRFAGHWPLSQLCTELPLDMGGETLIDCRVGFELIAGVPKTFRLSMRREDGNGRVHYH
jgi:hypothetical protein